MNGNTLTRPGADRPRRAPAIAAVLMGALVAGPAAAQEQAAAAAGAPTVAPDREAGATQQAIKVHGRWTIVIRDPDGTEVSRREFRNALLIDGKSALISLLMRRQTMGTWQVTLSSDPISEAPCLSYGSTPRADGCVLLEPSHPRDFPNAVKNLQIGTSAYWSITLDGTHTAQRDGQISRVYTSIWICTPDLGPTACENEGTGSRRFTLATAPTDFAVTDVIAGQLIQVTVEISFS